MSDLVLRSRQEIRDVLHGRDDRLLVIVGPCSIHDRRPPASMPSVLAAVNRELNDRLVIVMRTYFEKPRTTMRWKGADQRSGSGRPVSTSRKGMWLARKVLTDVLSLGLPTAHRMAGSDHPAVSVRPDLLGRNRRAEHREPGPP